MEITRAQRCRQGVVVCQYLAAIPVKDSTCGIVAISFMIASLLQKSISLTSSVSKFKLHDTIKTILNKETGSACTASGWIRSVRKQKNFTFAELSDGTSSTDLQVVIPNNLFYSHFDTQLSHGASLQVNGKLVKSPASGQPVEVFTESIEYSGSCPGDEYVIQKTPMSESYLRNHALTYRMRTQPQAELARLKSKASLAIHNILDENEFIQVYPPIITEHDCEGGGEAFHVGSSKELFFGKPAYLTVSTQLHLELAAASHPRVYSFSPVFRAENQQTTRHVCEFWMLECEMAFMDTLDQLLGTIESLLSGMTHRLGLDTVMFGDQIKRISYTESVSELQKFNSKFEVPIVWGADLRTEHERFIAEQMFKGPVFVTDYPVELKPFYMKANVDNKTVACCDLLVPGVGEIVGGSLREDNPDVLKESLTRKLGQIGDLSWYLDLRKYGGTRHGGFGLGFDRFLQYISGTKNIRDVIMIPRFCGSIKF